MKERTIWSQNTSSEDGLIVGPGPAVRADLLLQNSGNCSQSQRWLQWGAAAAREPRQLQPGLQCGAARGGQVSVGPSPIDKLRVRGLGGRGGGGPNTRTSWLSPGLWPGTGYWQKLLQVTKYHKLSYNNKGKVNFVIQKNDFNDSPYKKDLRLRASSYSCSYPNPLHHEDIISWRTTHCIKMSPEVLQIEDNEILYGPINQQHTRKTPKCRRLKTAKI